MRTRSTRNQIEKASFIEDWCDIFFKGDINDFDDLQDFIDENYDRALDVASEACLVMEDLKY